MAKKKEKIYQSILKDDAMIEKMAGHQDKMLNVIHQAICARLGLAPEGVLGEDVRETLCDAVVAKTWTAIEEALKYHGLDDLRIEVEE